jgi:hypothetical protein
LKNIDTTEQNIELAQRYVVNETVAEELYEQNEEWAELPLAGIPGQWVVEAEVTICLGESDVSLGNQYTKLSDISTVFTALKNAMATLEPPVVLAQDDYLVEIGIYDHDGRSYDMPDGSVYTQYRTIAAKYEQRFHDNRDVPKTTENCLLPKLVIDAVC